MKVRNGFVSNSSSSSFIVAVDGDKTKVTLTIEVDLADRLFDSKVCRTEEDLRRYFLDELCYLEDELGDEEEGPPKMRECLQALRDGKTLILGSFASDEAGISAYLCEEGLPESPGMDIIESEGGY